MEGKQDKLIDSSSTSDNDNLSYQEYIDILEEIKNQPNWRVEADRCADYYDGNQLDSETLIRMGYLGIAPIIENLFAPTVDAICGLEAKTRKDIRVTTANDEQHADLADAISQKLFEAQKECNADRANSQVFKASVVSGLGWLEVGRNTDPFKPPYRYEYKHRNEIFYDMKYKSLDYSDGTFLINARWYPVKLLEQTFHKHKELLGHVGSGWNDYEKILTAQDTGLSNDFNQERSFALDENSWRNTYRKRLRLNAVWYKRWVNDYVIHMDGGITEVFDDKSPLHLQAAYAGAIVRKDNFTKWRLSWWVGGHKLGDIANPFKSGKLPFIPFWGKLEDLTNVPYGVGRGMLTMQDEVNARNSAQIYLLASKRVIMTEGATVDDIEMVRQEAGRPDSLIVLDATKMNQGGRFDVQTDFGLNQQQYQALLDKRQAIKNVAGVYAAFEGSSNNQSGVALNAATEQSSQTLASLYDSYEFSKALANEFLMSLIIEDIGDQPTQVTITSDYKPAKKVGLNILDENGAMTNQLQLVRLKVALSDVPNSTSHRVQTLQYYTQFMQFVPDVYKPVFLKHMTKLMDVGSADKKDILEAIAKINGEELPMEAKTPEEAQQIAAMKEQAMKQAEMAMTDAQLNLDLKSAQVEKLKAEAQRLLNEGNGTDAEKESLQAKVEEYENDLLQATQEFDTKRLEIEERKNTALEVAKIQAAAQIQIAQMNSQDKLLIQNLQAEQAEIEAYLGINQPDTPTL